MNCEMDRTVRKRRERQGLQRCFRNIEDVIIHNYRARAWLLSSDQGRGSSQWLALCGNCTNYYRPTPAPSSLALLCSSHPGQSICVGLCKRFFDFRTCLFARSPRDSKYFLRKRTLIMHLKKILLNFWKYHIKINIIHRFIFFSRLKFYLIHIFTLEFLSLTSNWKLQEQKIKKHYVAAFFNLMIS